MADADLQSPAPEQAPGSSRKSRFLLRHRSRGKVECRRGAAGSSNNIGKSLIDVSEQGARLVVKEAIDNGRIVELRMYGKGDNRPVIVLGKVVRCEPTADGSFSLGVRFDRHIPYADLRRLT
jgi:hypothetical protein